MTPACPPLPCRRGQQILRRPTSRSPGAWPSTVTVSRTRRGRYGPNRPTRHTPHTETGSPTRDRLDTPEPVETPSPQIHRDAGPREVPPATHQTGDPSTSDGDGPSRVSDGAADPSTEQFAAWNTLRGAGGDGAGRANFILTDVKSTLANGPYDGDDVEESIMRAYGELQPNEQRRDVKAVAALVLNRILGKQTYLGPRGGARGQGPAARPGGSSGTQSSAGLLQSLQQRAQLVQQSRSQSGGHGVAEDQFGLDPFGLRDPAPVQRVVRWAGVSTDLLGGNFRALNLAGAGTTRVVTEEIWTEPTTPQRDWWWPGERPSDSGADLDDLPDVLEMPKVINSIWLGGPVTDGREVTTEVRHNLGVLSEHAREHGLQVVLWTDVPRDQFTQDDGDVAEMRNWAQRHHITLLSPDEVFHAQEPMSLAAEYHLETAKGTAAGYGAASDILRMEILYRFGGIYTDGDNAVHGLDGLRNLLSAPGFAVHAAAPQVNNSALLAARGHPFVKAYLHQVADNYRLRQDELAPSKHAVGNSLQAHREHYRDGNVFRRRSVMERTGPNNVFTVAHSLGIEVSRIPRIPLDQIEMGSAASWFVPEPRAGHVPPEQATAVLQHAVSGLIWDLRNRRGDLNLVAVAPLINSLPNPAAGWEAVVGYIHSVPQLRMQVQTVTRSRLGLDPKDPEPGAPAPVYELQLPQSVRDAFGLPGVGHAFEGPGQWSRAAYKAQVQTRVWSYISVDFDTRQRSLDAATPDMRALAGHLRGLREDGHHVQVWVEGGGARLSSSAGMDRATTVRQHLVDLAADPDIIWHQPTNRRTGATAAPVPPGTPREVMIWWTATPPTPHPAPGHNPDAAHTRAGRPDEFQAWNRLVRSGGDGADRANAIMAEAKSTLADSPYGGDDVEASIMWAYGQLRPHEQRLPVTTVAGLVFNVIHTGESNVGPLGGSIREQAPADAGAGPGESDAGAGSSSPSLPPPPVASGSDSVDTQPHSEASETTSTASVTSIPPLSTTGPASAQVHGESEPPTSVALSDPGADVRADTEPQPRLEPLPPEARDRWNNALADSGAGDRHDKRRQDAPETQVGAWHAYLEAFNAHQSTLEVSPHHRDNGQTAAALAVAHADLARWGVAPETLMTRYRALAETPPTTPALDASDTPTDPAPSHVTQPSQPDPPFTNTVAAEAQSGSTAQSGSAGDDSDLEYQESAPVQIAAGPTDVGHQPSSLGVGDLEGSGSVASDGGDDGQRGGDEWPGGLRPARLQVPELSASSLPQHDSSPSLPEPSHPERTFTDSVAEHGDGQQNQAGTARPEPAGAHTPHAEAGSPTGDRVGTPEPIARPDGAADLTSVHPTPTRPADLAPESGAPGGVSAGSPTPPPAAADSAEVDGHGSAEPALETPSPQSHRDGGPPREVSPVAHQLGDPSTLDGGAPTRVDDGAVDPAFAAWNRLVQSGGEGAERAKFIMAEAKSTLADSPYGGDDVEESIMGAYGQLRPQEQRRNGKDVAELVLNRILDKQTYLGPRGGARGQAPGGGSGAQTGAGMQSGNRSYLGVDFDTRQRSLDTATPDMLALAGHLRGLREAGNHVQVWIEGGGARRSSSAGMDRATAVRQHLVNLAGHADITWHQPTNRRTGPTAAPMPPGTPRQVMIWWTATPTTPDPTTSHPAPGHNSDAPHTRPGQPDASAGVSGASPAALPSPRPGTVSVAGPAGLGVARTAHVSEPARNEPVAGPSGHRPGVLEPVTDAPPADPLTAYHMIAPGLSDVVVRRPVDADDLGAEHYRHLTGVSRQPDGELQDDAIEHFERMSEFLFDNDLAMVRRRAGVTVEGVDDADLRRLIEQHPELVDEYPELQPFRSSPAHVTTDSDPDATASWLRRSSTRACR